MTDADPRLLSLLQKIANPITELSINLSVKGVFAPPQQWKTTDEANPNIFGYSIQFLNKKFAAGKIQQKIGGEPLVASDDKNKKGGKNPIKQEQKPVQLDPEALRKQKQWQALPQQERFYQTCENPQKTFSLKFPQNEHNELLSRQKIGYIEQTVAQGQAEIILIRKPQISEDQIAKLKKSKPKTLNLGQLYEAKYRGIIDLSKLQIPGCASIIQRVKLEFFGDIPADGVRIDTQTTYSLIQISFDKPLSPQVLQVKPQLEQVLPNIENLSKRSISVIQKLKIQITRAIKAVNQEYISFFAKEKKIDDKKNTGQISISSVKINQINRRRDIFLNDFNNSGKFALLRQRIALTLKAVIVDKFRKEKSVFTITKQQINRTLSQLNVFFQQFVLQTIDLVVTNENSHLHQDIILGHEANKILKKQSIAPVVVEKKEQKEARIAEEYQIINDIKKTEQKYLNLVLLHKQNVDSLQKYAQFLIKNKKFDAAYQIYRKINKQSDDFNHRFILCLFMVQRRRKRQVLETLTSIIESQNVPVSLKYLSTNCLSFMYEQQGDILRSQKYLALSQKYFQIHKNPQLKINPPVNPYIEPKPLIPKPQRYISQLSESQTQQMWLSYVKILEDNHFYDLLSKLLSKIANSRYKMILMIKVNLFNGKYQDCLDTLDQMLQREPNNLDLLEIKADICFKFDKIFQSEEVLLLILKQKTPVHNSYRAFLRLGYTYLNRKSWQDAKAVFEKVCELHNNCSVGWLGLGVALLQVGNLKEAQEAFSMSSIYDSLAQEPKKYLKKLNEIRNRQNASSYKQTQMIN